MPLRGALSERKRPRAFIPLALSLASVLRYHRVCHQLKDISLTPQIDSEYYLSDEELSRARHIVLAYEKQIKLIHSHLQCLNHDISDIENHDNVRFRALKAQVYALERLGVQTIVEIEVQKSILAPIRRVFPEILGEIFFHFLTPWNPLDGSRPWSELGSNYSPWLITRVCRRWRRIAFGTPQLWTVVHMAYSMNLPLVIPPWINSSGSLPFDAFLEFPSLLPQVQHPNFTVVLQAIWTEFHRCRTLFIDLSPANYSRFGSFLDSMRQCLMPALTTLIVHSDQMHRIGQLYAPNLRNLVVRTKHWHTIDLEPVRHVLPLPLPFLTTLYLEKISTTVDDMITFITASPDLIDCTLMFENLTSSTTRPSPISLPSLQSLSLEWSHSDSAITSFLCALHVPVLTSLSLQGRTSDSVLDFQHLLEYGQWGSMSKLTRLTMRKLNITWDTFVQFLGPHVHMAEIDFIGSNGLNTFVESLVSPVDDQPWFLPDLRKLSLSLDGDVAFETLMELIRLRIKSRSRVGGNHRRLDEFVLTSRVEIPAEHQNALREHLPHFTHVHSHAINFKRVEE